MQKIVLDTSVILKFVNINEEYANIADLILKSYQHNEIEILAPYLWRYESLNYCVREFDKNKTLATINFLNSFDFTEFQLDYFLIDKTIDIIKNSDKIAIYDAVFHSLAILEKATLITADEKYYQKAKKFGHIMLLKDYK